MQAGSGPIDILVIGFDGPDVDPDIGSTLRDLEALDGTRLVDLRFVSRDLDGRVHSVGIAALRAQLEQIVGCDVDHVAGGLLDAGDADEVGADLAPGTSALLLAIERTRTAPAGDAVLVAADAAPPDPYVVAQLERLQRLRDRGLLSADEHEALSARLAHP